MSRLKDWTPGGWSIVKTLNDARMECNADEDVAQHAAQDRTYGKVVEALITAMTTEIATANRMFWPDAEAVARRLYDEAADNCESIRWQVALWNEGVIGL